MDTGLSLRDREEMRDATMQRYVAGDITAVQARGELARQGWNATQISDLINEAVHIIVGDIIARGPRKALAK